MNEYIKNWKAEHVEIMVTLSLAASLNVCSKPCHEKILEAKDLILRHLKSEDEVLYPTL